MNRSYRLIWSHVRRAFVVADEHAKARGKSSVSGAVLVALAGLLGAGPALAMSPCGSGGSATIGSPLSGVTCTVTQSTTTFSVVPAGSVTVSDPGQAAVSVGAPGQDIYGINLDIAGTVSSNRGDALVIYSGEGGSTRVDSLTNAAGNSIDGQSRGIFVDGTQGDAWVGELDNSGSITSLGYGLDIQASSPYNAVIFGITNQQGGVISGDTGGIRISADQLGQAGSLGLVNDGTIQGGSMGSYAIDLNNALIVGALQNSATGLIDGAEGGIGLVGSQIGSLQNQGQITAVKDGVHLENSLVTGDLTNQGSIDSGWVGISLQQGSHVQGSIVNDTGATIDSYASGIALINSQVDVSLINRGTITAHTLDDAIVLNGTTVNGSVENSGTLSGVSTGLNVAGSTIVGDLQNDAGGIIQGNEGVVFNGSELQGTLSNSGTINGQQGDGLAIYRSSTGDIRNETGGLIQAGGDAIRITSDEAIGALHNAGTLDAGAMGIQLAESYSAFNIVGDLENSGTISAGQNGIDGAEGSIGGNLINSGTITSGVTGISLHNSQFGLGVNLAGNLENSGTITAQQNGIELTGTHIGGYLSNSGQISATYSGIGLWQSELDGDLVNQAGGTIASANDAGVGIVAVDSQLHGNLINQGTLQMTNGADGIGLYNSVLDHDLVNQGLITGTDDGILLGDGAHVRGNLINDTSGVIQTGDDGIDIEDATIDGNLINRGVIRGVGAPNETSNGMEIDGLTLTGTLANSGLVESTLATGILIRSESNIGSLVNTGTISGADYAINVSDDSVLPTLSLSGSQARLIGDVAARNTDVMLRSGSVFANENAFDVKSFTVDTGSTLLMGAGQHTANGLATDGITVSNGLLNKGTLSLASSVSSSIHGDYTQASSGLLKIGVADDRTFGKLVIDGTANLSSNAQIAVDVANPNYQFSVSSLQDVLKAGSLNSDGTFAVTDNSVLFNFGAVKDGNTVDLTLTSASQQPQQPQQPEQPQESGPTVESIVRGFGNSPAYSAARVLDQAFAQNPTGALAAPFVGLTTNQQVSNAVSQTLPLLTGSGMGATNSTLAGINRVIQARQESNSGLSSGDAPAAEQNLWMKTFGSWADQDERSGVSGYDANTTGLAIGADAAVTESARLGLAFTYANTDLDSDSKVAKQSADIDSYLLIGYGSYSLSPDTELNFQVDAGQHKTHGKRDISFAGTTAKADYDSYSAHAGVGLGHSMHLSEALTFQPSVRADYTWIGDDAYSEKGAGALDLNVDRRDAEALVFSTDGKLSYALGDNTALSANLGVGYDVINESTSITSAYAGEPGAAFATRGIDPSPWVGHAGVGLTHNLATGTEVSLRYDAESRSDFLNQGASLRVRWAF